MKFYSAVEINGSAYVKVTTTNFLNVSSTGLFYNFQNSYGDNYFSYYENGIYLNNSFGNGFNTLQVGNGQMNYYCYSTLGTGQFSATATSFTAYINNGGNVSITNGGTEINDFSTSGNLNLTSANAIRFKTGSYYAALKTTNLTALRTHQLPNADGTIALTSDVPDASKILMVKSYPPVGSNTNTFTTTGLYVFTTVPAEQSSNMPILQAGVLEVIADTASGLIYQKYRGAGNSQYKRLYGGSTWGAWEREPNVGEIFKTAVSPYSTLGFADNGIYFHTGSEVDNPMPGYTGYSINKYYTGQYSFQMYAASSYSSGSSGYVDGLFWRSNNAGGTGSGWNTPWIQAASRDWVTAQGYISGGSVIQNQNASAQSANFLISGSAAASKYIDTTYGYCITSQSGYTGFFTDSALSTAHNVKMGSLVISSSYSSAAPTNGLYVLGKSYLIDNVGIGTSSPTEKLDVSGSIKQSAVTSKILKADSTGKIVAAVAGTDYLDTGSVIINQFSSAQAGNAWVDGTVRAGSLQSSITSAMLKAAPSGEIVNASAGTDYTYTKRGYITVTGNSTTMIFGYSHSMGTTPTSISITPKSNVASKMWNDGSAAVTAISSTSFTITFTTPPGSGQTYEYWFVCVL